MELRLGFLLPRSTDYPSMGFDMLDGLRVHLELLGITELKVFTENIGFGDDQAFTYARAEKLLLQDDVQILIAFSNIQNAENLYSIAQASGRFFLFLDSGMQLATEKKIPNCWFISFQGLLACKKIGAIAGKEERKALMASSFFDAGYRGILFAGKGLEASGGSVVGHYVSTHKISDFSIDRYLELLDSAKPDVVIANFSIYLEELFLNALKTAGPKAISIPFYCSPFMGEEQILSKCDFPGGAFEIIFPWSLTLNNAQQQLFVNTIKEKKNKIANLFHLFGWEAAQVIFQIINNGQHSISDWSYESPRGTVTFHPSTQITYAPLYKGKVVAGEHNKCMLQLDEKTNITPQEHELVYNETLEGVHSGWKNNFFCS